MGMRIPRIILLPKRIKQMIRKEDIKRLKEKDFINRFKPDYWITINPKLINKNDDIIYDTYHKALNKFYKNQLGKKFNEKKDKQMEQEIALEYGKLAKYKIRQPHLHILMKSNKYTNIDKFIEFLQRQFLTITNDLSIEMAYIDSLKDTVIKGGYMLKEGEEIRPSKIFTHFTLQQGINY